MVHRVEHLRGDHKGTLRRAAFARDERLRAGQLPERHGVAEVAAGDHNDVRERKDLVEPMQSGHVLDLGKNFQLLRAGLAQGGAHGAQIVRAADKGLHERGDAVFPRAAEIFHIHLRERARGQLTARDGKALAGSEHPAALHAAGHRPRVQNAQGERAVVEQQFVAVLQISGQDRRDGKGFAERERIALAQRQRREKRADAQLRTLQVDEQVTGNALRGLGAAQAFQPRRTLFEGTVGKVQAHAAHPRAQQSAECIRVGAGGAERAVELAGHGVSSLG